jgi:Ca2+-binding EF-hand superfamily protein
LDVDSDYDGFITAEDLAKLIHTKENEFKEIEELMKNRDSKRVGKLGFQDFCRWMGGTIEPCEGFYFRHDSVKNPQYENNIRK